MNKSINIIFLFCLTGLLIAQDVLKEMEVTVQLMDQGVSAQPNTSKLVVKSNIINPSFESNRGITKVVDQGNGLYTITLSPGNQRIGIKANGYLAYNERYTFERQKVYECIIKDKSEFALRNIEEDLYETSFVFNVPDVYCSFNDNAPNQSVGKRTIFKLPEDKYTFHFKKDGFKPFSRTIVVDKDNVINIELIKDSSQRVGYQSPGIIVLTSLPEGAEIILDGQKYGYTNKTLTGIMPGKHQLTIGKNKYFADFSTFDMSSGEIKNINVNLKQNYGYLNVKSHPNNVEIFIDNNLLGYTPLNNHEIESGKYRFSANMELYHSYSSEEFEINDSETTFVEFELKPAFGGLEINSVPVDGAEVLINGNVVGKTPFLSNKFPSGEYTIEVSKEYYSSVTENITVTDEMIAKKTIILNPTVGNLVVNSEQAEIYLNDIFMSKDRLETKLSPGTYRIKLGRDNYYTQEQEISIYTGRSDTLNVELIPIQGSISVVIEPAHLQPNTEILINGISFGNPPLIRTLTVGSYLITAKVKRKVYNQSVNIMENQDLPVQFVVSGDKQLAATQKKVNIAPKQQKSDTPKAVEKEKKNIKPIYYISAAAVAVAVAGGAYYYYLINRPGTIKIDIDLSGL